MEIYLAPWSIFSNENYLLDQFSTGTNTLFFISCGGNNYALADNYAVCATIV